MCIFFGYNLSLEVIFFFFEKKNKNAIIIKDRVVGEKMKIYILHNNYLNTFIMPREMNGSCIIQDYDENSNPQNLITAYVENNKWVIKSDEFIKIMKSNQYIETCVLNVHEFYFLKTNTNVPIVLYTSEITNSSFLREEVIEDCTIKFGKDNTCDVVLLKHENFEKEQFELTYKNNKWYCHNLNPVIPIYCNGIKINNETTLNNFDRLFIMGIKIIIFGKTLFISNSLKEIYVSTSKLIENKELKYAVQTIDTSNQVFNDFYSPDDYFSKSPVFVKKTKTLELEIVNPNPKEKSNSGAFIMNMVPTVLMSLTSLMSAYFSIKEYQNGDGNKENLITAVIMCVIMLFVSIVWPLVEEFAEKIGRFVRNKSNSVRYKKYMKDIQEIFVQSSANQKMALVFNSLSLKECEEAISNKTPNLYSINPDQNRFLNVRLGSGKVKLDAEISFNMTNGYETKDKLQKLAEDTIKKYEYIEDAPYTFSLKNSLAFVNINGEYSKYYEAILLQLITFYDYYNLKIVVFTSKNSKLYKIRNLNHCWNDDQSIRYFATDTQEAEIISGQLIRILNQRKESNSNQENNSFLPHYLIISDDVYKYRNISIINKITGYDQYTGFSAILFAKKMSEVPTGFKYFLEYNNENEATLFESEMSDDSIISFKPEFISDDINFEKAVSNIINIPVKSNNDSMGNGALPEKYGFLEMFNVGNVEQLNSISRWKNSQVTNTLATPIGMDTSGSILKLDLHEKAHGPHGLIAGMTGSGKSETIVSYILSLAVNYSPNEVQFVLIDYKGGGLAGAFENRKTGIKLPHLVGTITNLDKSSMNRTLVSIKSELQRRQRVFNTAKETLDIATIDIYKYQELVRNGLIKEPMAHLFIICDEFAELKAQQPDFMDELVSAARIGRSLGIHLILATQKPSGVVDEQIWSNSKFKICAKVQTAQDSQEMINKPDAAYIKESGRFYLQVGYDEIFVKAQSAYTGIKYVPRANIISNNSGSSSINFIDNIGNIIKSIKPEEKKLVEGADLGDELGNVTKYLIECSKKIGFTNKQLWLDNVPKDLLLYPLINKYKYGEKVGIINPIVGEYDDPSNQKQGPVSINITEKGNLWICGMTGSGKTTLLSTLIYSTIISHSPKEVNLFILDLVTENLRIYSKAPQVADIVTANEHDRINKLIYFLKNEIDRRKKILALTGKTFKSLSEKGENHFPALLICINGYDVLFDSYYDLLDEVLTPVIRESGRVGINFVLTSTSSISSKLEANFPQRIALRFVDPSDYLNVFESTNGIIPIDTPGRGLVDLGDIYEFQVAQIFKEEEFETNLAIINNKLNELFQKAEGIPNMPKVVSYENVKNELVSIDSVPIGYEMISNCVCFYNFDNLINLVLYDDPSHAQGFEIGLIKVLKRIKNTKIVWLDALETEVEIENVKRYSSSFGNLAKSLYKTINEKKSNDPQAEKIIFIISGYSSIEKYLEKTKKEGDSEIKTLDNLIMAAIGSTNYKFILIDSANIKSIDNSEWIDYYDYNRGILLARDPEDQEIFEIDESIGSNGDIKYTRDIATVINQGISTIIKYIRK